MLMMISADNDQSSNCKRKTPTEQLWKCLLLHVGHQNCPHKMIPTTHQKSQRAALSEMTSLLDSNKQCHIMAAPHRL